MADTANKPTETEVANTATVPPTLDEALDALGGIGKLLTAKKWERAAILAAYVKPERTCRPAKDGGKAPTFLKTAVEFAELGIVGLTDRHTVARYVNAWMAEVGVRPTPGQKVKLPTIEFPPAPPVYSVPIDVWETVVDKAGLTPTHDYDSEAVYAANVKPADKESDLQREAAAGARSCSPSPWPRQSQLLNRPDYLWRAASHSVDSPEGSMCRR